MNRVPELCVTDYAQRRAFRVDLLDADDLDVIASSPDGVSQTLGVNFDAAYASGWKVWRNEQNFHLML
jgi:hypothetical protein